MNCSSNRWRSASRSSTNSLAVYRVWASRTNAHKIIGIISLAPEGGRVWNRLAQVVSRAPQEPPARRACCREMFTLDLELIE